MPLKPWPWRCAWLWRYAPVVENENGLARSPIPPERRPRSGLRSNHATSTPCYQLKSDVANFRSCEGDVQGSVEAIVTALHNLSKIHQSRVHAGVVHHRERVVSPRVPGAKPGLTSAPTPRRASGESRGRDEIYDGTTPDEEIAKEMRELSRTDRSRAGPALVKEVFRSGKRASGSSWSRQALSAGGTSPHREDSSSRPHDRLAARFKDDVDEFRTVSKRCVPGDTPTSSRATARGVRGRMRARLSM